MFLGNENSVYFTNFNEDDDIHVVRRAMCVNIESAIHTVDMCLDCFVYSKFDMAIPLTNMQHNVLPTIYAWYSYASDKKTGA